MSELEIVGPFRRVVVKHGKHIAQEGEEGRRGGSSPGFTMEEESSPKSGIDSSSENGDSSEDEDTSQEGDTSQEREESPESEDSSINEDGSEESQPTQISEPDIEYWGFKIGDFKLLDKQDFDSGEEARQKEAAAASEDLPKQEPEKENALERAMTVLTNAVTQLIQRQERPEPAPAPEVKVDVTVNPEIKMDFPEHEQTMVVERDEDRFITKIIKRFTRGALPKKEKAPQVSDVVRPGLGLEPVEKAEPEEVEVTGLDTREPETKKIEDIVRPALGLEPKEDK